MAYRASPLDSGCDWQPVVTSTFAESGNERLVLTLSPRPTIWLREPTPKPSVPPLKGTCPHCLMREQVGQMIA